MARKVKSTPKTARKSSSKKPAKRRGPKRPRGLILVSVGGGRVKAVQKTSRTRHYKGWYFATARINGRKIAISRKSGHPCWSPAKK